MAINNCQRRNNVNIGPACSKVFITYSNWFNFLAPLFDCALIKQEVWPWYGLEILAKYALGSALAVCG